MNLGTENEILEFKKSTSELKVSMDDICSMLNKHCKGSLYFGVKPNGDVVGQIVSVSTLNDIASTIKESIEPMIYPQIEEIHIDEKLSYIKVTFNGKERPYSSYGRYYKRVVDRAEEMTPSELKHMMFETDYTSMWENNLTKYTLDDIDDKALKNFYDKSIACGRLESLDIYNKEEPLRFLGLYENGHLTNAGYVLFSNKSQLF